MAKMSEEEKKQWKELLNYIEKNIFNYDDNQHLQKNAIIRLRGALNGKAYANNATENNGNYSPDVVLNTFKINRNKILYAIQNKEFESEEHKMAYCLVIIRDGLNDMYMRMQRAKKSEEDGKKVDTSIIVHKSSAYKRKTIDKEEYNNLW